MKTVTFIPALCKGESPIFSGSIELRLPNFDEKYEYIEKSNIHINDAGEVDAGTTMSKIAVIRQFVKLSEKHYVSVSLKKLATGEEFKSFEDLQYDGDAHNVLIEVATQLVNGVKLGNG